jgi:hypothetical protein
VADRVTRTIVVDDDRALAISRRCARELSPAVIERADRGRQRRVV